MSNFTFTDMAVDYSVDELDDLTDRKVAPEGIDGDRLARIIRARRGAARAAGQADPYFGVRDAATTNLWDSVTPTYGNRRMAAVGGVDGDGVLWGEDQDGRYITI